ncbi:putative hexosyltransferase [Medicago truncatula]|uniref:Putative hexosyltransferase n=1 Tax=Medicago truncatula TaxID=3880 RepID=A0A072TK20_MEDTR|nr:UDP-glycosyltransferase 89A2 [Medicago truncatula]KEH17531.1 UDP-glucosyltransferase family protein [Medicago truncatula]RHN55699.1 putative hexosyltransferase [Medicago truncatula]
MSNSKTHIFIFPYPAQGHMLPLLDLTHQLALQSTFTITIIVTPKNLPILTPLLSTHPNTIKTLIFPFPSHPKIPSDVENLREIGNPGNYPFINALSNLQNPIIQWFNIHHNPPVALISDFFLGWTQQLATQLNIPRIAFYSSGAFLTAVINRCWRNPLFFQSQEVVEFNEIHGTPSFKRDHLPSLFRRYVESDPESEFVKESFISNDESWGFVINTFSALEGGYLDNIEGQFGNRRLFAVGPLGYDRVGSDLEDGSDVLRWLDRWDEDGSVLYVCFGSQKLMRRDQMEALAFGLERSGIRFVWVVKVPSTVEQIEEGYGLVPEGFEDWVSGRGIVVKGWVPQIAILGHRVVGGFLSHCGWNSVLEAVVAGVGILGWPMEADQFVNAKLLVEDMGVAVRVCEGMDTVPDPNKLGRVISSIMSGDSPQKKRAKLMKEEALRAVSKDGVSSKELNELVHALQQLGVKERS